jgi:hypothetical protein
MTALSRRGAATLAELCILAAAAACVPQGGATSAPLPGSEAAGVVHPVTERFAALRVPESHAFGAAVAAGTRTRSGVPGDRYWQQWARYSIAAELLPSGNRLEAEATIVYFNRSPRQLPELYLHLHQNLYAPDAMRNEQVPAVGGLELTRVAAGGRALDATLAREPGNPGYSVDGTILRIRLPAPIATGDSVVLAFSWTFPVPPDGAPREGTDGETWMIAYWYPQLAVHDDVSGWHLDPYLGNAEFYMGYGDYDVSITVPEGFLLGATGVLVNAADVLSARTLGRLAAARSSGGVVSVVGDADRSAGISTTRGRGGKLTWRWSAPGVRDFAWAASAHYLWDATLAVAGDASGSGRPDTVLVHALYRPSRRSWAWDRAAEFGRHSIEFLSEFLWPYPYPQATAVDGVRSCTGMEYPMITCIGGPRDSISLYSVTVHELAHFWFPMRVGSDEKRHSWQDEGLTRFNQNQSMRDFFPTLDRSEQSRANYLAIAGTDEERPLMTHGDLFPLGTRAFGIASYDKPATNIEMLRALLGEATFMRAYREYGRRWENRHPTPHDFFNTFGNVSGRDLDWFWRAWWYETWTLDQRISRVTPVAAGTEIEVEDRGMAPMPARLRATTADGAVHELEIPVETWLAGARLGVVTLANRSPVVRVELDPQRRFAYVTREGHAWPPR